MQRVIDVEVSHNQLLFRYSNHRQLMSNTRPPSQGYTHGNGAIRYLANIKHYLNVKNKAANVT